MKRKYTKRAKPIIQTTNLPPDILESIERSCEHRKALNLFDDKKERVERALRYQEFRRGRNESCN